MIIIYSDGKVGTTTLMNIIAESGLSVARTHCLSDSGMKNYFHSILNCESYVWHNNVVADQLAASLKIRNEINRNEGSIIISGFREPVSLSVSKYFEGWATDHKGSEEHYSGLEQDIEGYLENETKLLKEFVMSDTQNWLSWFDSELKSLTGFDFICNDFDNNVGYEIYKHENYNILIYKVENIKVAVEKGLNRLIDTSASFKYIHSHITSVRMKYPQVYLYMINNMSLDCEFLEKLYSSEKFEKYYTPEEAKSYSDKWSTNKYRDFDSVIRFLLSDSQRDIIARFIELNANKKLRNSSGKMDKAFKVLIGPELKVSEVLSLAIAGKQDRAVKEALNYIKEYNEYSVIVLFVLMPPPRAELMYKYDSIPDSHLMKWLLTTEKVLSEDSNLTSIDNLAIETIQNI